MPDNDSGEVHVTDQEIRRICSVLESIATNYPLSPIEADALEEAAHAYVFLMQRRALAEQYHKLRSSLGGELTEEMEAKLRAIGIDPNVLEALDGELDD